MINELKELKIKTVIGVDEVGIGCLAGPVVACAVFIDEKIMEEIERIQNMGFKINDSKLLEENERLFSSMILKEKVKYKIGMIDVEEINKDNNIHKSSEKAKIMAIEELLKEIGNPPDKILLDGDAKHFKKIIDIYKNAYPVIKGDSKYYSIASASILAKEYRDLYMCFLAEEYDKYNLQFNKGYCTPDHIDAIKRYGLSNEIHRYFARKFDVNNTNPSQQNNNNNNKKYKKYKKFKKYKFWKFYGKRR